MIGIIELVLFLLFYSYCNIRERERLVLCRHRSGGRRFVNESLKELYWFNDYKIILLVLRPSQTNNACAASATELSVSVPHKGGTPRAARIR